MLEMAAQHEHDGDASVADPGAAAKGAQPSDTQRRLVEHVRFNDPNALSATLRGQGLLRAVLWSADCLGGAQFSTKPGTCDSEPHTLPSYPFLAIITSLLASLPLSSSKICITAPNTHAGWCSHTCAAAELVGWLVIFNSDGVDKFAL